jgi:hypothetical protein
MFSNHAVTSLPRERLCDVTHLNARGANEFLETLGADGFFDGPLNNIPLDSIPSKSRH